MPSTTLMILRGTNWLVCYEETKHSHSCSVAHPLVHGITLYNYTSLLNINRVVKFTTKKHNYKLHISWVVKNYISGFSSEKEMPLGG